MTELHAASELHCVERPVSGAPLVVLVHGTMDRSTSFHAVMGLLSDCSVLAYDRRGYARSRFAEPPATSLSDHVDDLLELIDGRPAVVVGHSLGGDVALAAAERRPDVVRAVGAYEAPMPWIPEWPQDTAGGEALRTAMEGGDPAAAVEAFLRRMIGNEAWEMLPQRAKEDRRGEGVALVNDMRSLRAVDGRGPLDPAAVKVPVVVAHGSASKPHQVDNTRRLAELLPDAELMVIEGAQHGAHASHPEGFAAFARRVIARASS